MLEWSSFGPGLTLFTGPNGSGKSSAARELAASVPGARLLSAESQQAFYEAELKADESNFQQGVDTSSTPSELLGEAGRRHALFAAFRLEALVQALRAATDDDHLLAQAARATVDPAHDEPPSSGWLNPAPN